MSGAARYADHQAAGHCRGRRDADDGRQHEAVSRRAETRPAGFKPLASGVIRAPGDNWAPMALVDGKLLVRGQKELKAQVAQ